MSTTEKILQTMNSWQWGELIVVPSLKCSGAKSQSTEGHLRVTIGNFFYKQTLSKHNWASPQSKANLLLFKCVLMKECIHKSTKDMLKDHSSNFCILNSTVHTIQIDVLLLAPLEVSSVHNTSSCFLLCNKSLSQISWNLLKLADDYCLVHAYNPQVKLFA